VFQGILNLSARSCNAADSRYKSLVRNELLNSWGDDLPLLDGRLSACLVYFYFNGNPPDADNISKPIWDALTGVPFADDQQICLRQSCLLTDSELAYFELPNFLYENEASRKLRKYLKARRNCVYLWVGPFQVERIQMNLNYESSTT
jgi:hypothetical protein